MRSHQNYLNKNQFRSVRNLLLKALIELKHPNPTQAIDLGCGLGIETAYLARLFEWSVLAIDGDAELLNLAKEKIKAPVKANVEFQHRSFETITELPACDFLYTYHALHFIDKSHFDRFWQLILSTIKPGGVLCVSLFGPDDAMVKKKHALGISVKELTERLPTFTLNYVNTVHERGQETLDYSEVIATKV